MHAPRAHQGSPSLLGPGGSAGRIWLIAGTGEGPPLAQRLLARGWRLRISLVTPAAALAYPAHPRQELAVGAIGGDAGAEAGVAAELARARTLGSPYTWVIDATHPFASRISLALARICTALEQPLLRLHRPELECGRARRLDDLNLLGRHCRPGERLLLAIGARRLAEAMAAAPQALHHARVLAQPDSLAMALAAGLAPGRLAPLRPGGDGRIERALCRHWRIETLLCRRSGGVNEARWHRIATELGLRLLLLERPREPGSLQALPLEALLQRLEQSGTAG